MLSHDKKKYLIVLCLLHIHDSIKPNNVSQAFELATLLKEPNFLSPEYMAIKNKIEEDIDLVGDEIEKIKTYFHHAMKHHLALTPKQVELAGKLFHHGKQQEPKGPKGNVPPPPPMPHVPKSPLTYKFLQDKIKAGAVLTAEEKNAAIKFNLLPKEPTKPDQAKRNNEPQEESNDDDNKSPEQREIEKLTNEYIKLKQEGKTKSLEFRLITRRFSVLGIDTDEIEIPKQGKSAHQKTEFHSNSSDDENIPSSAKAKTPSAKANSTFTANSDTSDEGDNAAPTPKAKPKAKRPKNLSTEDEPW